MVLPPTWFLPIYKILDKIMWSLSTILLIASLGNNHFSDLITKNSFHKDTLLLHDLEVSFKDLRSRNDSVFFFYSDSFKPFGILLYTKDKGEIITYKRNKIKSIKLRKRTCTRAWNMIKSCKISELEMDLKSNSTLSHDFKLLIKFYFKGQKEIQAEFLYSAINKCQNECLCYLTKFLFKIRDKL